MLCTGALILLRNNVRPARPMPIGRAGHGFH